MIKKDNYSESYTYANMLHKICGMSPSQFSRYVQLDNTCAMSVDGEIPMYALISTLHDVIQTSGILQARNATDIDDIKVQTKMAHEKLMATQISNQTKLGILMRKSEMYLRVIKFITTFQNLMKNIIMVTAQKMSDYDIKKKSKRDNIIFLTKCYNDAITFLEDNVNILSWEADGAYKLTHSRLEALKEMDDELNKEIEEINSFNEEDISSLTQVNDVSPLTEVSEDDI